MATFIETRKYCNNHPAWSAAFSFRIRDSFADSNTLEYLATELDMEDNCANV